MVASISSDLRQRVVDAYKRGGLTYADVSEQFSVGRASVSRWLRLDREVGSVNARPHGGGREFLVNDKNLKKLEKRVLAHPDWTEDEYTKAFNAEVGLNLSDSTVGRAIRRLGYGVKKKPWSRPNKTEPMSSLEEKRTRKIQKSSPLRVLFLWTKPV
jgi:transposase